jgi:formyltetrahydrofolate hydrolase
MSNRTKIVLLVAAPFVIGIIVGSTVTATWMHFHKKEQSKTFLTQQGFVQATLQTLQPSESQRDSVLRVAARVGSIIANAHTQYRLTILAQVDSLQHSLTPILTNEQRNRIQREIHILQQQHHSLSEQQ